VSDCPHEDVAVTWNLDQDRMTLWGLFVECRSCGARSDALEDEVTLGPWSR